MFRTSCWISAAQNLNHCFSGYSGRVNSTRRAPYNKPALPRITIYVFRAKIGNHCTVMLQKNKVVLEYCSTPYKIVVVQHDLSVLQYIRSNSVL